MKAIRTLALLLVALSATFSGHAQATSSDSDPYLAEVKKMLAACDTKQLLIKTIDNIWSSMEIPMTSRKAAAREVVNTIWPDLVQDYMAEYKKYFTLEDLQEINAFYNTPTGKKFALYSVSMASSIQQLVGQKYSSRVLEIIMKYIK